MLVTFALVLAVLVLVVLVGAGGDVCAGGVRAGFVGVDVFVLLVGPGVLMCRSYSSVVALVVVAAFVLTLVLVLAWGAGVPC